MKNDKDQQRQGGLGRESVEYSPDQQKPRSGAFNEPRQHDQKSTVNQEEEADLEQQRKETLTERD